MDTNPAGAGFAIATAAGRGGRGLSTKVEATFSYFFTLAQPLQTSHPNLGCQKTGL
jgi:hypothetical protein